MPTTFPLRGCKSWQYTTSPHAGTCVVDGERIDLKFTVKLRRLERVPDVLEIERFCERMTRRPSTVEGYAEQLRVWLDRSLPGTEVAGKGKTSTHGPIRCRLAA